MTDQTELREVMEQDPHRPERLVAEIRKAIAELPTLHPEGSKEHHCDLIHADRLILILEGQK